MIARPAVCLSGGVLIRSVKAGFVVILRNVRVSASLFLM